MPDPAATAPAIPPVGEDSLYEVVNGLRVEPPPMGAFETHVASLLAQSLGRVVWGDNLGRIEVQMLFLLDPAKDLQRRPDLAFVSFGRWPRDRRVPRTAAWEVVPDLAVEVVSPSDTAPEVLAKVVDYFAAGVRLVWVVYPIQGQVYAYRSPRDVRVLLRENVLDGGDVVAGFRLPLATLFEDEALPA